MVPDDQQQPKENKDQPTNESEQLSPQDEEALRQSQSLASIEAESTPLTESTATPAVAPQPLSSEEFSSTSSSPSATPPKKKKWPFIAGALALVFVVLGGSGAAAYMWYQNPEKVVLDSIVNAMQSKTSSIDGELKFTGESGKVSVKFDAKGGVEEGSSGSVTAAIEVDGGLKLSLSGDGVYAANGDVYFRAKDLEKSYDVAIKAYIDQTLQKYKEQGMKVTPAEEKQARTAVDQMIKPVIEKVDNQWIKVSVKDMKELDEDAGKEYECTQRVLKKLTTDKEFSKQLREIYAKNKAFTVKEGIETRGDSKQYIVEVNKDASEAFQKDLKELPVYKELQACTKESTKPSNDSSANDSKDSDYSSTVELWVHQWNHTLTGFNISGESSDEKNTISIEGTTQFNQPVTVTPPNNAKSLNELKADLEKAFSSMAGQSQPASRSAGTSELF